MKNQANNVPSVLRNVFTSTVLACALIVSSASTTYANDKKEAVAVSSPVKVTYLGEIDKQPVIQIDINNGKQEELYVTLRDEYGYNLYSTKVSGGSFSKKFQFSDLNPNDMKVTLSLASKNEKKPQVFEINNRTTVVEGVVVTKVD